MVEKLAFIGSGELAESLLKGFLDKKFISADHVWMNNRSNTERLTHLENEFHVHTTHDKKIALQDADIVIFAFRPADTQAAIDEMKAFLRPNQLIISLMVGVPTAFIQSASGIDLSVVRAMPNTSASIGLSATGIAAGAAVSDAQLELAKQLFETVGTVTIVKESEIDVIAGLSGSGPAYLYYLAQAMQEAGVREGIPEESAAQLVLQTLLGASHLLNQSGKSASDLLKAVATPGGTTQAGIDTLNKQSVNDAVIDCVHQAIVRAKEMSAPFSK
ncbi:pyrroline-5-carboxylate reductase [Sporolactobacillus laevolacticus]|uniref:Pyrroline-5-carboxylate reductase n=1 Tax=Sporolactobacillus laevolacticus DSM 442 TaxID=1395513 RepID=V6J410_9BACL|nr:pyrroline-5-carboxylate reductase [Sporolactobacillus laevolacticus]EST11449.1 pyrroline-5-carboxylate reductase [Sporolactobacillus laevolacticus DSM 442]